MLPFRRYMVPYWVMCLLITTAQEIPSVKFCEKLNNWWEARICCHHKEAELPSVHNRTDAHRLREIMKRDKLETTWINVELNDMGVWQWVDGSTDDKDFTNKVNGTCAWYNQKTKSIEAGDCSERNVGSICQFNDPECLYGHLKMTGVGFRGICYVHFGRGYTWHESRAYCRKWNYTFSIVADKDVMDVLAKKTWVTNRFWVGLRRIEWISHGHPEEIIYKYWDSRGQPGYGKCGRLRSPSPDIIIFEPTVCHKKSQYICLARNEPPQVKSITESKTSTTTNGHFLSNLKIAVSVVGIIAGTVLMTVAVGFLIKRKSKLRHNPDRTEEEAARWFLQKGSSKYSQKTLLCLKNAAIDSIINKFGHIEIWSWFDETISLPMEELYTDLSWVRVKRAAANLTKTFLQDYTDIFDRGNNRGETLHVYIQGQPGSGKTTMSKKILLDWASYLKSNLIFRLVKLLRIKFRRLSQFDIIIPIFMRDVKENENMESMICRQLDIHENCASIFRRVLEDPKRKVLIILEGYDEYRENTSSHVTDLAHRKTLKHVHLLVTSRLSPEFHYRHDNHLLTSHVFLHGFSDVGKNVYISKFFKNRETVSDLSSAIENTPGAGELSQFPAILLIICIMWRDTHRLANNITDFYKQFVIYICCRYEKKTLKNDTLKEDHIIENYHQYLMQIAEVAKNGLIGEQLSLTFPYDSVKSGLDQMAWELGFLKCEHTRLADKSVSFPHKTVQEYFTAFFIVHCDSAARVKLLTDLSEAPNALREANMIVTFLKGMKGELLTEFINNIIKGNEIDRAKTKTAVQITYLADLGDTVMKLPTRIELELSDQYTAGVLKRYCSMDADDVREISAWASHVRKLGMIRMMKTPHLEILKVYQTDEVTDYKPDIPEDMPHHLQAHRIEVTGFNNINIDDILIFTDMIGDGTTVRVCQIDFSIIIQTKMKAEHNVSRSEEISFRDCGIEADVMIHWLEVLERTTDLANLDIHCYESNPILYSALAKSFKWTPRRVSINMYHHRTDEGMTVAGENVSSSTSVIETSPNKLFYCGGQFNDQGPRFIDQSLTSLFVCNLSSSTMTYDNLKEKVTEQKYLKELRLYEQDAVQGNIKPVVEALGSCPGMQVLDLAGCVADDDICTATAALIQKLNKLVEFRIFLYESENAILPVITSLTEISKLQILDLSGNLTDATGASVLDTRGRRGGNRASPEMYKAVGAWMREAGELRELRLCKCDVPPALKPVVTALQFTPHLQTLDLSGNMAELEVVKILGDQLKTLNKLKELRLCACEFNNALDHVISKLQFTAGLNVLDISGVKEKMSKRSPYSESHAKYNTVTDKIYKDLGVQLTHLSDLRELRLCRCDQVDAVRPVIRGLQHIPRLHTLDLLENEATSDVFTELGKQLYRLSELRELLVCYCERHNAVKEIIQNLHHTPGLVVLDLTGTMVTRKERGVSLVNVNTADPVVYETLSRQLQRLSRLRELRVGGCPRDRRGEAVAVVSGLQYTPGLQVLEMRRWSLTAAGVEQLGERLVNLREMRQLLLGGCDVYDMNSIRHDETNTSKQLHQAWAACITRLSELCLLQGLDLSDNNIGIDSVVQLSRQLPSLTHLDALSMVRCGLTDTQAVLQLIDALPSCPTLRLLSLEQNHLGDGLEQIIKMTQQLSGLYGLDLEYNKLSDGVVKNIKQHIKKELPQLELLV